MADLAGRLWRMSATGLCFTVFGLGGVIGRVLIFPLLRIVVRDERRRVLLARRLIRAAFCAFVALMRGLGVISVEVHGRERLQRHGMLILSNHPSLIDVVLLMAMIDRADCIVKSALAHSPFTSGPVRAAGFVFNDTGAGLVDDCIRSVRAGHNLIVFPEGTRTPRGGPMQLQRGSANIALRGGLDITPVRIRVTPPTLSKGEPWYRVPPRRAHFVVEVDPDIPIADFAPSPGREAVAARRLTDHLTQYFSRKPAHGTA